MGVGGDSHHELTPFDAQRLAPRRVGRSELIPQLEDGEVRGLVLHAGEAGAHQVVGRERLELLRLQFATPGSGTAESSERFDKWMTLGSGAPSPPQASRFVRVTRHWLA